MTPIPGSLREVVVRRAGDRCEYCRLPQASQVATFPVDHVLPVALHGQTTDENLCLACPRCNARKWIHVTATDPQSGEIVPLFNPRVEEWTVHFRWGLPDTAVIEALTPRGRATLALLEFNASRCLAIRRWLAAIGMHPLAN